MKSMLARELDAGRRLGARARRSEGVTRVRRRMRSLGALRRAPGGGSSLTLFNVVASLTASVCFLVVLATGWLGTRVTVVVDDYLCWLAPVLAGVACLYRRRREGRRGRDGDARSWALLASSCLSWGAGGLVWTVYEIHLGQQVPYPSLADVGYLAAVPLAITALVRMSGLGRGLSFQLRDIADGALAGSALLFISWATVLGPLVADSHSAALDHIIALAYPTTDVLTGTIALLAVARARGPQRTVMTLIGLGLASVAVSDSSFAWFTSQDSYATGNLFDTGYLAGYLLIATAALHPGATITRNVSELPTRAALSLPYLPVLAVGVLGVILDLAQRPLGAFLFWDGAAMLGLVLARQLISLSANVTLGRQLQETVDALREREVELAHRAYHDALTGLPNRARFHDALARTIREEQPVTVLLIDLDDFKKVNDTLGHHAGDVVLKDVATRLRTATREDDVAARLGGDEFAVLLLGATTPQDADAAARRILNSLEAPIFISGCAVRAFASIGISFRPAGSLGTAVTTDTELDALLRCADEAMYQAKRAGKNRHHVATVGLELTS